MSWIQSTNNRGIGMAAIPKIHDSVYSRDFYEDYIRVCQTFQQNRFRCRSNKRLILNFDIQKQFSLLDQLSNKNAWFIGKFSILYFYWLSINLDLFPIKINGLEQKWVCARFAIKNLSKHIVSYWTNSKLK